MSVSRQLFQLQEVDLELTANEHALERITSQLGESKAVINTRRKLAREQQNLANLQREQQSVEWEIDDLSAKLATAEEELYSGRIRNPKELANLQHEVDVLKDRRSQLEDKALEIMGGAELAAKSTAALESELKALESEWQGQQEQLAADLEQVKTTLADLKHRWQRLAAELDAPTVETYRALKKQKGTAVARVEQGICRGCRISLPVNELQQTRSGHLVRCSSCGRILFLA